MSLEAWGDEGNVPENGEDTAIYQELLALRVKTAKWQKSNMNDFGNDEQIIKSDRILEMMDSLLEDLAEAF